MHDKTFYLIAAFVGGTFSIMGAYFNWDFFFKSRKARFFVNILGRQKARYFYVLLGIVLYYIGFKMM